MRKHTKVIAVAACLLGIAAMTALLARAPEPQYKGRTLSEWYQQYEANAGRHTPTADQQTSEASEGIRRIGTNALPFLLKMLRAEASPRAKLRERILAVPHVRDLAGDLLYPRNQLDPLRVFKILGEQGSPAVPELATLLQGNTNSARLFMRYGTPAGVLTVLARLIRLGLEPFRFGNLYAALAPLPLPPFTSIKNRNLKPIQNPMIGCHLQK